MSMLRASYPEVSVGDLCGLFGKSRHAYYDHNWRKARQVDDEELVLDLLLRLRDEIEVLGTPAIYKILQPSLESHGIRMGRDRLHELRRRHNLLHRKARRSYRTTDSNHRYRKWPNLVKDLAIERIEQVFYSDITYLRVGNGFEFLSLISDGYSRKLMGHCLYPTLEAEGPLRALRMSLDQRQNPTLDLYHHSDRGVQYCCDAYIGELLTNHIHPSMTENSDPRENAVAERLNGILKTNFGLGKPFGSSDEAHEAVERAVYNYNELRPHSSVSMLTPSAAHQSDEPLQRMWKSRYKEENAARSEFS